MFGSFCCDDKLIDGGVLCTLFSDRRGVNVGEKGMLNWTLGVVVESFVGRFWNLGFDFDLGN